MWWENKHIIGLAGIPGSGKTTVAQILQQIGYHRMAFGTKLKETAKFIYGIEDRYLYGTQEDKEEVIPELGVSGRFILQRLGTDVCRIIHPDTWILAVLQQVKETPSTRIVIDDVRFQNELEFVNQWGEVWRIRRRGTEDRNQKKFLHWFLRKKPVHIAERPDLLKRVSLVIDNTDSLVSLQEQVKRLELDFTYRMKQRDQRMDRLVVQETDVPPKNWY